MERLNGSPASTRMSMHLIGALKNRRNSRNWKTAFWSLGSHLQKEILFWAKETGVSCQELVESEWKREMLEHLPKSGRIQ